MAKLLMKRAAIICSTLRNRSDEYKAELLATMLKDCGTHLSSGTMQAVTDSVYPLSEAANAHKYVETNKTVGKVILT